MPPEDTPRLKLTDEILNQTARIAQMVGELTGEKYLTIHPNPQEDHAEMAVLGSLKLEDSFLTLERTRDLNHETDTEALSRQEREAKNALAAYAALDTFDPSSVDELLRMHRALMDGLMAEPGVFRAGNVGVYQGNTLIHQGAPAREVKQRVEALCEWLRSAKAHPLIRACVFHYELELIHPFSDGNGPLGRLCQTAILAKWHPIFRFAPVEALLSKRRMGYFNAFIRAENAGECGEFVLFMLGVIRDALTEVALAGQAMEISGNDQADLSGNPASRPKKEAEDKLMALIRSAPCCTQEELAASLQKSPRTVRAMMRVLQQDGVIRREGARKNGRWIIREEKREEKNEKKGGQSDADH